jgi:hypothetical protein
LSGQAIPTLRIASVRSATSTIEQATLGFVLVCAGSHIADDPELGRHVDEMTLAQRRS